MKFLKTSRVCLVTRGRYAGKKVRHAQRIFRRVFTVDVGEPEAKMVGKLKFWGVSGKGAAVWAWTSDWKVGDEKEYWKRNDVQGPTGQSAMDG